MNIKTRNVVTPLNHVKKNIVRVGKESLQNWNTASNLGCFEHVRKAFNKLITPLLLQHLYRDNSYDTRPRNK